MKKNTLKIADFQFEKISQEAQKTVKGGVTTTPLEEPNPLNNGGGNGNG
ncbi:rSAM-modified peptide [Flavobacterium quisquiliarum]|uniref:Natural product n=1 Tax=Flavobacterium quisquiliarum TaxID=1834436 RepID=A0ABV8W600_9FLAO|nr:rSAM-modified peptide [Flavobacterium quisquiliarum]MBW1657361.1 rSAM-modified peptide [Flavobacterium quisquiliarum]NWL01938.1 rSAM-modified peptide [Flavobacterium collinsii]